MTRLPFTVVIRIDTLERAHEAGYVIHELVKSPPLVGVDSQPGIWARRSDGSHTFDGRSLSTLIFRIG